jgi:hypothetical protein
MARPPQRTEQQEANAGSRKAAKSPRRSVNAFAKRERSGWRCNGQEYPVHPLRICSDTQDRKSCACHWQRQTMDEA